MSADVPQRGLDQDALLKFLAARGSVKDPLVAAIYSALAERIKRGDFDMEEK